MEFYAILPLRVKLEFHMNNELFKDSVCPMQY